MSSSDYREPTNDELWSQPPAPAGHPLGLTPQHQQPPLPAVRPQAPMPQPTVPPAYPVQARQDRTAFALAIVSLALAIPLTAIASGVAGLIGMIIAWVGIILVNAVYARSRQRPS